VLYAGAFQKIEVVKGGHLTFR